MKTLHKVKSLEIQRPTLSRRQEATLRYLIQHFGSGIMRTSTSNGRKSTRFYRSPSNVPYYPFVFRDYMEWEALNMYPEIDWSKVTILRS